MNKRVLILSGSPRKLGNSDILCDEFMKGAIESGNIVKKIRVQEKKIAGCLGCYYCEKNNGKCVQKDDMEEILQDLIDNDVIVLSSPVYFYSICSQLKALIDRSVARWTEIRHKTFYYIATSAEDSENVMDGTLACFRGFVDCCDGSVERGMVLAKGVYNINDIKETPYIKDAYELGKSI